MQKIMQNNAAVFRTGEVLKEGCELMEDTIKQMPDLKVCFFIINKLIIFYYELMEDTMKQMPDLKVRIYLNKKKLGD